MGYWAWEKAVLQQAWQDFMAWMKGHMPVEVLVAAAGIVGGAITGDNPVLRGLVGAFTAVGVLTVVVGAFNILRAPYRLYDQLYGSRGELRAELNRRDRTSVDLHSTSKLRFTYRAAGASIFDAQFRLKVWITTGPMNRVPLTFWLEVAEIEKPMEAQEWKGETVERMAVPLDLKPDSSHSGALVFLVPVSDVAHIKRLEKVKQGMLCIEDTVRHHVVRFEIPKTATAPFPVTPSVPHNAAPPSSESGKADPAT